MMRKILLPLLFLSLCLGKDPDPHGILLFTQEIDPPALSEWASEPAPTFDFPYGAGGSSSTPGQSEESVFTGELKVPKLLNLPWVADTFYSWLAFGPRIEKSYLTLGRQLNLTQPILSDSQFVWGPQARSFDTQRFLAERGSELAAYTDELELWANYTSVNPKILLAILEYQHQLISNPDPAFTESQIRELVSTTAMDLAKRFYEHLYLWGARKSTLAVEPQSEPTVNLSDGTAVLLTEELPSGTAALAAVLAPLGDLDQLQMSMTPSGGSESFLATLSALFPEMDPLDNSYDINPPASPQADLLQLPFPLGATWRASGAHSWDGDADPPFSSLDFFAGSGSCGAPPNLYAVASADGPVERPWGYTCWLEIDHGGGWETSYYHLLNLYSGAPTVRNSKVGTIGCEICAGGYASGPHLHWSLKYNGAYVDLEGVGLSGWTVHPGDEPYTSGSYERDGVVLPAYSYLYNDYHTYYGSASASLLFHGNEGLNIDRVKIRMVDLSLGPPADVGAQDFTIEWWIKTIPGQNTAGDVACGADDSWRTGNILLDRDRYNQSQDYGVALTAGKIAFGVGGDGAAQRTLCGSIAIDDGEWHHVVVQRRRSDGRLWIFLDGVLDAESDGPDGDISYPNDAVPLNVCGGPCSEDPFLVIGGEKHGVDPGLLSFHGWIDELRISNNLRYSVDFSPPEAPFGSDGATQALYHLDEAAGLIAYDTSGAPGGPSNASLKVGGTPVGPEWSDDTPFSGGASTPTFADVPTDHWAFQYIELLFQYGIVQGCSLEPRLYCPENALTRAESAVFVLRGEYGGIPEPPYPPPLTPSFSDVPTDFWGYDWIESLLRDGFTAGCLTDPLKYCPYREQTRAEGSVFFLRVKNGFDFQPPPAIGIFQDVAVDAWYADWLEAAHNEGILPECESDPLSICPLDPLDRARAAYMMVQALELPLP